MNTARHQVIPRPFRRTAGQDRRLELRKSMTNHAPAQAGDDLRPQDNVLVKVIPAQVQETVFQAGLLRPIVLDVHLEGQRLSHAFDRD